MADNAGEPPDLLEPEEHSQSQSALAKEESVGVEDKNQGDNSSELRCEKESLPSTGNDTSETPPIDKNEKRDSATKGIIREATLPNKDSSELQDSCTKHSQSMQPATECRKNASASLTTQSVLDFSPEEIKAMRVSFAYCHFNRESQRIALSRQKDFFLREGELELVIPVDKPQADSASTSHENMQQMTRPVTKEDLTGDVSLISITTSFKKTDCPANATTLHIDPILKKLSSGRSSKKRPNSEGNNNKKKKALTHDDKEEGRSSDRKSARFRTPAKVRSPESNTSGRKYTAREIESIPAPEPEFAALPGWTRKEFERRSGATKGTTDKYWYSPACQKKFRSMNEVRRFLECLEQTKGNEEEAYNLFKK